MAIRTTGTIRAWLFLSALASIAYAAGLPLERIQFEQETLSNGLHVIYAPQRQAPVIHVRVVYHVGSRDERPDRQGFAHLFEHMMFRGSAHVADGDYVRLIRQAGGNYNGVTERDTTTYFETLPRNQLALGLYLEADRMASFHVSDGIFRVERNVVLQELSRRSDIPEVEITDEIPGEIFRSYPYRWDPAGSPTQLQSAEVQELQQFFDRFYVPNNATLILTGDFDLAAARRLVMTFFQWIPRGPDVVRNLQLEPPQSAARQVEMMRPVPEGMVLVGCRAPSYGSDDEAAAIILSGAIRGRLRAYLQYSRPLCSQILSNLVRLEDDGYLCFGGELLAGSDAREVQRIINVQLTLLRQDGFIATERDFGAWVDDQCSMIVQMRQTVEGLGDQVGQGAVLRGQPDAWDRLIERMRKLTVPMVNAAVQRYLKPESLNYISVLPRSAASTMKSKEIAETTARVVPPIGLDARSHATGKSVDFPGDYPPAPPARGEAVLFHSHPADEFEFNGIRVALLPQIEPHRMEVRMILPRGYLDDPIGREGLNSLTLDLVLGMAQRPQFDPLVGMSLHTPFNYWKRAQANLTEIIISAPADEDEHLMHEINHALCWPLESGLLDNHLMSLKWRYFDDCKTEDQRVEPTAVHELNTTLFGNSFLGRRPTAASLRQITRAELEANRRTFFDFNGATIILSGNLGEEQARSLIAMMLDGWSAAHDPLAKSGAAAAGTEDVGTSSANRIRPRIILVDNPDAHQAAIRIGSNAFGWGSARRQSADLAAWILSQRIFTIVRSEQGYAYVANATFEQYCSGGLFSVRTATSFANVAPTLGLLLDNIRRMSSEPVRDEELASAKSAYAGLAVTQLQTSQQQAVWRAEARIRGDVADVSADIEAANRVTADEIRLLFAQYARDDKLAIVVVAPSSVVKDPLQSLGDVEIRPMPGLRPGAATRPAYEEIPRPM